jgi:hypothetical protein
MAAVFQIKNCSTTDYTDETDQAPEFKGSRDQAKETECNIGASRIQIQLNNRALLQQLEQSATGTLEPSGP